MGEKGDKEGGARHCVCSRWEDDAREEEGDEERYTQTIAYAVAGRMIRKRRETKRDTHTHHCICPCCKDDAEEEGNKERDTRIIAHTLAGRMIRESRRDKGTYTHTPLHMLSLGG